MDVYIVRIYRNERGKDKNNPHMFVGLVEVVATEEKKSFRNFDEFREILISTKDKK
jgi:predicted RNA-binding protein